MGVRAFAVVAHNSVGVVYFIVVAWAGVAGADPLAALGCVAAVVGARYFGGVGDGSVPVIAPDRVAVLCF